MATNPMQRRAKNSFLLGTLITTLILGTIIAGLVFLMMNMRNEQEELQAAVAYALRKDVKSGDEIQASDLEKVSVPVKLSPSNKITPDQFQTTGEDGNVAQRKVIAKTDLKSGVIVTADMLYIDATSIGKDVRKQEYNTVVLPMDLETGDYIDVRLLLPNGQDFIVVAKKKVTIPQIAGVDSIDTINIELSEDETLSMSNAIVEAYMIEGSKLYAAKYTDAGNQEDATPTYPINSEVRNLMNNDPNILDTAKAGLAARYNSNGSISLRENYINSTISAEEGAADSEKTKMQESITNSKTSREQYLQSLTTNATSTTSTTTNTTNTTK